MSFGVYRRQTKLSQRLLLLDESKLHLTPTFNGTRYSLQGVEVGPHPSPGYPILPKRRNLQTTSDDVRECNSARVCHQVVSFVKHRKQRVLSKLGDRTSLTQCVGEEVKNWKTNKSRSQDSIGQERSF